MNLETVSHARSVGAGTTSADSAGVTGDKAMAEVCHGEGLFASWEQGPESNRRHSRYERAHLPLMYPAYPVCAVGPGVKPGQRVH